MHINSFINFCLYGLVTLCFTVEDAAKSGLELSLLESENLDYSENRNSKDNLPIVCLKSYRNPSTKVYRRNCLKIKNWARQKVRSDAEQEEEHSRQTENHIPQPATEKSEITQPSHSESGYSLSKSAPHTTLVDAESKEESQTATHSSIEHSESHHPSHKSKISEWLRMFVKDKTSAVPQHDDEDYDDHLTEVVYSDQDSGDSHNAGSEDEDEKNFYKLDSERHALNVTRAVHNTTHNMESTTHAKEIHQNTSHNANTTEPDTENITAAGYNIPEKLAHLNVLMHQHHVVKKHYFIAALVVTDKSFLEHHHTYDYQIYITTVMNMAADYLHDYTIGFPINLSISRIIYLQDCRKDFTTSENPVETMGRFCEWAESINPKVSTHPYHHDIAILITRRTFDQNFTGSAFLGGACQRYKSCIIVRDNGLIVGISIAHQIGHLLGAPHDKRSCCSPILDDGCNPQYRYIMNDNFKHAIMIWSDASRVAVSTFLRDGMGACLEDEPPMSIHEYPGVLPGVLYDADMQCKFIYGNAMSCISQSPYLCKNLYCKTFDGQCESTRNRPAQGTPCAENKWCYNGECVQMGEHPHSIAGNWGPWGDWNECSRTCGDGVQISKRQCDNPPPQFGGKYCEGERRRVRMCNNNCSATAPSFLSEQCSAFDNYLILSQRSIWKPLGYIIKTDPCGLYCVNENMCAKLKPRVLDGTPCGTTGVCVEGQCLHFGCDGVMGSGVVVDRCGICGGDGSHCHRVDLNINNVTCAEQAIATIPAGACAIRVNQKRCSECYYMISRHNSTPHHYYLNESSASQSGEFNVEGMLGTYSNRDNREIIIDGPLPVAIDLHYTVGGKNCETPIAVSYMDFGDVHHTKHIGVIERHNPLHKGRYHWEHLEWSICSARCGIGTSTSHPQCVSIFYGLVSDFYCDRTHKPVSKSRICNKRECKASWRVGPWYSCQLGMECRPVQCVQESRYYNTPSVVVHSNKCNGKRPEATKKKPPTNEKPQDNIFNSFDDTNIYELRTLAPSPAKELGNLVTTKTTGSKHVDSTSVKGESESQTSVEDTQQSSVLESSLEVQTSIETESTLEGQTYLGTDTVSYDTTESNLLSESDLAGTVSDFYLETDSYLATGPDFEKSLYLTIDTSNYEPNRKRSWWGRKKEKKWFKRNLLSIEDSDQGTTKNYENHERKDPRLPEVQQIQFTDFEDKEKHSWKRETENNEQTPKYDKIDLPHDNFFSIREDSCNKFESICLNITKNDAFKLKNYLENVESITMKLNGNKETKKVILDIIIKRKFSNFDANRLDNVNKMETEFVKNFNEDEEFKGPAKVKQSSCCVNIGYAPEKSLQLFSQSIVKNISTPLQTVTKNDQPEIKIKSATISHKIPPSGVPAKEEFCYSIKTNDINKSKIKPVPNTFSVTLEPSTGSPKSKFDVLLIPIIIKTIENNKIIDDSTKTTAKDLSKSDKSTEKNVLLYFLPTNIQSSADKISISKHPSNFSIGKTSIKTPKYEFILSSILNTTNKTPETQKLLNLSTETSSTTESQQPLNLSKELSTTTESEPPLNFSTGKTITTPKYEFLLSSIQNSTNKITETQQTLNLSTELSTTTASQKLLNLSTETTTTTLSDYEFLASKMQKMTYKTPENQQLFNLSLENITTVSLIQNKTESHGILDLNNKKTSSLLPKYEMLQYKYQNRTCQPKVSRKPLNFTIERIKSVKYFTNNKISFAKNDTRYTYSDKDSKTEPPIEVDTTTTTDPLFGFTGPIPMKTSVPISEIRASTEQERTPKRKWPLMNWWKTFKIVKGSRRLVDNDYFEQVHPLNLRINNLYKRNKRQIRKRERITFRSPGKKSVVSRKIRQKKANEFNRNCNFFTNVKCDTKIEKMKKSNTFRRHPFLSAFYNQDDDIEIIKSNHMSYDENNSVLKEIFKEGSMKDRRKKKYFNKQIRKTMKKIFSSFVDSNCRKKRSCSKVRTLKPLIKGKEINKRDADYKLFNYTTLKPSEFEIKVSNFSLRDNTSKFVSLHINLSSYFLQKLKHDLKQYDDVKIRFTELPVENTKFKETKLMKLNETEDNNCLISYINQTIKILKNYSTTTEKVNVNVNEDTHIRLINIFNIYCTKNDVPWIISRLEKFNKLFLMIGSKNNSSGRSKRCFSTNVISISSYRNIGDHKLYIRMLKKVLKNMRTRNKREDSKKKKKKKSFFHKFHHKKHPAKNNTKLVEHKNITSTALKYNYSSIEDSVSLPLYYIMVPPEKNDTCENVYLTISIGKKDLKKIKNFLNNMTIFTILYQNDKTCIQKCKNTTNLTYIMKNHKKVYDFEDLVRGGDINPLHIEIKITPEPQTQSKFPDDDFLKEYNKETQYNTTTPYSIFTSIIPPIPTEKQTFYDREESENGSVKNPIFWRTLRTVLEKLMCQDIKITNPPENHSQLLANVKELHEDITNMLDHKNHINSVEVVIINDRVGYESQKRLGMNQNKKRFERKV